MPWPSKRRRLEPSLRCFSLNMTVPFSQSLCCRSRRQPLRRNLVLRSSCRRSRQNSHKRKRISPRRSYHRPASAQSGATTTARSSSRWKLTCRSLVGIFRGPEEFPIFLATPSPRVVILRRRAAGLRVATPFCLQFEESEISLSDGFVTIKLVTKLDPKIFDVAFRL